MIGIFDYTVVATYMSLMCSIYGMILCVNQIAISGGRDGDYRLAVFMLALSGLLDMLDGKIARTKKNRTEDEKNYGIQLDSLCDVVCFGIYPIVLAYCIGMRGVISGLIFLVYAVSAVARLAFFNVEEGKRQEATSENRKEYHGLPVTSIAVVFPIVYFAATTMQRNGYIGGLTFLLQVALLVTGVLFIVDFKVKKPGNLAIAIMILLVSIVMIFVFRGGNLKRGEEILRKTHNSVSMKKGVECNEISSR